MNRSTDAIDPKEHVVVDEGEVDGRDHREPGHGHRHAAHAHPREEAAALRDLLHELGRQGTTSTDVDELLDR